MKHLLKAFGWAIAAIVLLMLVVGCKTQQKYVQPDFSKFKIIVHKDSLLLCPYLPYYKIVYTPYMENAFVKDTLIPILN